MVVHELGGALTPTRNSLQLLQARDDSDPDQERLLQLAQRGLERADRILKNVSSVATLDPRPTELEDVALQPRLQQLVDEHADDAQRRGIQLRLHVESDARGIPVEGLALEQVVSNLLSNALKFTARDGSVRLMVSRARGPVLPGRMILLAGGFGFRPAFVQLQVVDSGIGISAETRRRLFQPFFRGAEAAQVPGLGLGLAVSQRLARRMRGDLRVESPKNGATFILTLPADRRTIDLIENVDRVHEELHAELSTRPLAVAVLRRRSAPELAAEPLERAVIEACDGAAARVVSLGETLYVAWSAAGVRPFVGALSRAIRNQLGAQADRDFEIAVRRAAAGTLPDPLLLQTAVRCRHALAAIARKREVFHVENPRRGR